MLLLISWVVFSLHWLRLPSILPFWYVCYISLQPRFPMVRKTSANFISTLLLYVTWSIMQVLSKTCHKTEPAGTCNCNTYSFSTKYCHMPFNLFCPTSKLLTKSSLYALVIFRPCDTSASRKSSQTKSSALRLSKKILPWSSISWVW